MTFESASPAPRGLLYIATFGRADRAMISAQPDLRDAIRNADPGDWLSIIEQHRAAQRVALAARVAQLPRDDEGMRAQALHDLSEAARTYARLQDDRRNGLFSAAARLARYVTHGVLSEAEVRSALRVAAAANGALGEHGARWADRCISRAFRLGQNDPLPPLARRFKTGGAA